MSLYLLKSDITRAVGDSLEHIYTSYTVESYINEVMDVLEQPKFGMRVTELRLEMDKKVSARDMSLSLGQSAGYINNIENGHNYPSMEIFFYICEYFGITPQEFFDTEIKDVKRTNRLLEAVKGLNSEQLDNLTALAKGLRRE